MDGLAMPEWTIDQEGAGVRLDAWLACRPEVGSRGRARMWIARGKVFLNGEALLFSGAGRRLKAGDRVHLWIDRPGSARAGRRDVAAARNTLRVVYEDRDLVVVDKPAGMLVEPLPQSDASTVTMLDLVADHVRPAARARPRVVHRIDRDTTGLVVFALTLDAQQSLKAQFERRTPERVYLALLRGKVQPPSGVWKDRLVWDKDRRIQKRALEGEERARDAIARYRVVEQFERAALVEIALVTGKRNQIRKQAALRNHPLVGERLYVPQTARPAPGDPALDRQALHAHRLSFRHPTTGACVNVEAPVPADLARLVARLRENGRTWRDRRESRITSNE